MKRPFRHGVVSRPVIAVAVPLLLAAMGWVLTGRPIRAEEPAATAIAGNNPAPISIPADPGNLYFETPWHPQTGMRLLLTPDRDDIRELSLIELDLNPQAPRFSQRPIRGATPPEPLSNVRWRADALPQAPREQVEWLLKTRTDHWLLYCNDRLVAWFPVPFPAPLTVDAHIENDGIPLENAFFQRVPSWRFSDDFMIPETDDDVVDLGEWTPVQGQWHVHSVADHANAPTRRGRALDPEFSPNFYSMKGRGTNALITAGYDFYDHYRVSAAIELQPGEMGLAFYFSEITQEYYAFTLTLPATDTGVAQGTLWHTVDGDPEQRRYLAAARIPDMFAAQWVRMEIETRHDRIITRMDGQTIFDIAHDLPGGGAFGFFADSGIDIIFDDVAAVSVPDLDLRDAERIRFHTLAVQGDFFPKPQPSWWDRILRRPASQSEATDRLQPALSQHDQWLVLGSPHHRGQVLTAMFHPLNDSFHAGWVAGFSAGEGAPDASSPHFRVTAQRSGHEMIFRLFQVQAEDRMSLLEQFRRPATHKPGTPVELKLDMSENRFLRLYCDGKLVLIHENESVQGGGAGPFVGADTSVAVSDIRYQFSRDDLWTSSQEKNPVYLADPFMRHWSSPEGEWYTDESGLTWHKSDFFGRYHLSLPVVSNAAVHLGVREEHTNGTLTVTLNNEVASLYAYDDDDREPQRLVSVEITQRSGTASTNQASFTLHYEDHWLLMTLNDQTVFRHALEQPFRGTRVRIEGFTIDDLAESHVERHNVKDHLFTEAPADWRINGGDWRVVNRFQCDPRWSHMNAESRDNLAAAWSKDLFDGDFSIEMYAGMRHGWYHRCGDMNITALSHRGTPSEGYTVTCTGWDPDHSQLDSILYRYGQEIKRSDAYLAPRHRAGNRRRHREEIIRAGRDVHGAWYYIKLRRIGNRLEYYFDNELVLTWEDEDPIEAGRVGIWTYMNSIMIARVSISAQNHEPAPIDFEILPVDPLQTRTEPQTTTIAESPDPHQDRDGETAEDAGVATSSRLKPPAMSPADWRVEDLVGHAHMTWHQDAFFGSYFTLTTRLGGGRMFARHNVPPQPYHKVAGWRFFLKRTQRANLNAYFSIGQLNQEDEYEPIQKYFHRISGTGFDRGNWQKTGSSDISGTAATHNQHWHMKGTWQEVNVWLPTDNLPAAADSENLLVRFEGLGVQQPSYEMQGLYGNGPGEAYAVARFAPVWMQPPFESAHNAVANTSNTNRVDSDGPTYRLYHETSRERYLAHGDLDTIIEAIHHRADSGINRFWLESDTYRPGYPRDLMWLDLPDAMDLRAEWCQEQPDTAVITSAGDWPERRLARAKVLVNGHELPAREIALHRYQVMLPAHLVNADEQAILHLTVTLDPDQTHILSVDTGDPDRLTLGPVLTQLEGITPLYENFENLDFGTALQADSARMRIQRDLAARGSYVEIANRNRGQRLRADLTTSLCLARYPLLQFDYRGDRMSFLTLRVHDNWFVKLNESRPNTADVRFASPLLNDGDWHTWTGMISESVEHPAFNPKMYRIRSLRLGSFHKTDQTGVFSRWALREIVAGPAVATAEQLAFTPHFDALGPIESVMMALHAGIKPVDGTGTETPDGLSWQPIKNKTRVQPDIEGLPDGPAQLLLRAVDAKGKWSSLVSIPFLLDRKPMDVTSVLEETRHPLSNGNQLRLDFDTADGAPVVLEDLRLGWNDQPPVEIGDFLNKVTVRSPGLRVELNWPHLVREAIQQHDPEEPALLRVSGLRDGAGNRTANIEIPIAIPDADDDTGPALLPATYSENVFFNTAWEGREEKKQYFTAAKNNPTQIVHEWNERPFLNTRTHRAEGTVTLSFPNPGWSLEKHPYLAFRLRQRRLNRSNPAKIDLVIKLENNETVRVSLTQAETTDEALALSEPIEWEVRHWHSVFLNLPEILQNAGLETSDRQVQSIAFDRSDTRNREHLDIKDLYVFGNWTQDDTIAIDAYDRSGIDGLEWAFLDRTDETLSDLHDPREPAPGAKGWLVLRVRDRAQNLSLPLRIPMVIDPGEPPQPFTEFIRNIIMVKPLGSHGMAE